MILQIKNFYKEKYAAWIQQNKNDIKKLVFCKNMKKLWRR